MASTIKFTFNSQPADGTLVSFTDSYTGLTYTLEFNDPSESPRPVGTTNVGPVLAQTGQYFDQAFHQDYNALTIYSSVVAIFPTVFVEISGLNPNTQWSVDSNTTAGAVTTDIVNDALPSTITITDTTISEAASDPCTTFDLDITTSVLGDNLLAPVSEAISGNPHSVEGVSRANEIQVTVEKIGAESLAKKKIRVPLLLTTYFSIDIINTPSGGSVTATRLFPWTPGGSTWELLPTLQFSLDDVDYVDSNSWSGLDVGSYTMYIQDNIGCKISIDFDIDAFSPNLVDFDAVCEFSKLNSFRLKKDEAWANCGIRKNSSNSLSHEESVGLNNRSFKQLYQTCDTIREQLKSNYENNNVNLVDCEGTITPVTLTKVTENMNINDVRDGTILQSDTNTIGIIFGAGLTYDPITLLENGSYDLGDELPDWINVGDYVNIPGVGWTTIVSIVAPDDFLPWQIYTSAPHDGLFSLSEVVKITTVYNNVDYERYEFEIDMSSLLGDYYLTIESTDDDFETCNFKGEWFNVAVEQDCKHHLIDYWNTVNNEINFGTGITFRIRLPYTKNLKWKPNDDQEIYVTDTKTILLENRIREQYEILLSPMPTAMAQKAVLILSQDRLQIDGENYVREGEPEITPFGTTNLYQVRATLVKSDYVFSNTGGTTAAEILLGAGVPLEIDDSQPGLLWVE